MFPVAAVRWSTGDFKWHWSRDSGFECYFRTWIYQFPLRSEDRQRSVLQGVETYSDGAVFWVAMVRVCPAVLCCNSLRNTMARVYSSADLWGCWSTYYRAYFSPPIAIVSCCQQMFCNSSCILLLGIEQKQTLKSNKHGNGTSFLSSKKLFFFFLYFLCLLLQIWSSGSGLAARGSLGHLCLLSPLQLSPISFAGSWGQCPPKQGLGKVEVFTKSSSTARFFPQFLLCQQSQLCTTYQTRSGWKLFFLILPCEKKY